MRTTVTLDDDAYEIAAIALAETSGKRLGQAISNLIRRSVQKPQGHATRGGKRFPTFEVPSGAPMISLKAIRRAGERNKIFALDANVLLTLFDISLSNASV